jgi:hypothetical protein
MTQTVTHIDTKRSILWTFNNPENEKLCRLLTNLYLWTLNDKIKSLSDEQITIDLKKLILNINQITNKVTMIGVKILERNRVDDLIY